MIPYFNAGIFLENKQQIGKVDEILGPMKQYVCEQGFSEHEFNMHLSLSLSLELLRFAARKHEPRFIQKERKGKGNSGFELPLFMGRVAVR